MRFLRILAALAALSIPSLAIQSATGWCEQGGQRVTLNGSTFSTGYFQRSFPVCTVTIYLTGTSTLATIYSDSSMTPKTNPFLASTTGQWIFYAADGNYDVQLSGAGISVPFKLVDIWLVSSGGGGGSGTVTTTGSPASGNLAKFSGAASITNGDLTGDVTTSGTLATTLATVNSNTGACGDATHVCQVTLNGKGLATAATPIAISGVGGSTAFSALTSSTNTTAAMLVGSGATLGYTGTGHVSADKILDTTITGITGMVKMTAGTPSAGTKGSDYVSPDTATNYTPGAKQSFSQSATTAGINLGTLSIDPSVPTQGDLWYNGGVLKYRTSSATLTVGGGACYTTVTFSATPTFTACSTVTDSWTITLTGNVTSSTLASAATGEILTFNICQDGTGGRTFVFPANVLNAGTVDTTISACSHQTFVFDGTNAQALGTMIVTGISGSSLTMPGSTSGSTVVEPQGVAAGTTKLPTNNGSLPLAYFCGSTSGNASCANTDTAGTARVFGGIATLSSSSAVISSISPAFTSTSTYSCVANDITTRANPVQVDNTSASSITITNTTGASDVIHYICVGY